jgi:hypothetical protein
MGVNVTMTFGRQLQGNCGVCNVVHATQAANRPTGKNMIRTFIVILILAIIVILAGVGTGFIDINQIRGAKAPELSTTANGVVAHGGQTPAFDVETGSVSVGTKEATVKVPEVRVNQPADNQANATQNQ